MAKAEAVESILSGVFDRFKLAEKSIPAMQEIAAKLVGSDGGGEVAAAANVTKALTRLLADGKLSPEGLSSGMARLAIESVLGLAGQKLDPLSTSAIKFINGSFDKCGGGESAVTKPPAGGPPIKSEDGKHVIVYCVETKDDAAKTAVLPAVREDRESTSGDPFLAAAMLRGAFEMW